MLKADRVILHAFCATMTTVSNIHHKVSTDRGFDEPCGVAIGSFDGVHLGHQAIVRRVVEESNRLGLKSRLLTFYPRPSEYFAPDKIMPSLMSWREKVYYLSGLGLDDVICMPFNKGLSRLSAERFIQDILIRGLNAKYLTVGADFRFGTCRVGDTELLKKVGIESGFNVEIAETQTYAYSRISSTRIRESLLQGDLKTAELMLGRPYSLAGRVIRGNQLGRQMGVPTANVHLRRSRICVNGVYAVSARCEGEPLNGLANIGFRPTVDKLEKPLLEVHLLDYDGDLYGKQLEVELLYKIRGEQKFDSLQLLQQQILRDVEEARSWHLGRTSSNS